MIIVETSQRRVSSIQYAAVQTRFGLLVAASDSQGICFVGFARNAGEGLRELKRRFPGVSFKKVVIPPKPLVAWLSGREPRPETTLSLNGTPFQIAVWKQLLHVPRGSRSTYAEIAKRVGRPRAVRAVGTAVGKNPIALLIPCHRVVPSTGCVGQYHWGSKRKAAMLAWEAE